MSLRAPSAGTSLHRVSAALIATALASCTAYGTRPESPAHGGRAWAEANSQHFRVIADLPADEAAAMALELEQALDAIDQVAFEHARTSLEPTTVVVFSEGSDFHAFAPELIEGRFYRKLPGDLEPSRFMLLHGTLSTESRIACLHELTHDLFERNFGPAPAWLNEGWAQYYSTIQIEPDRLRVGAALPQLTFTAESEPFSARADDGSIVLAMPIESVATPSQLLRLGRDEFYRASAVEHPSDADRMRATSLYLGSWALVHMLHDGPEPYPTRFNRFLQNVRRERVETAWQSAFAGVGSGDFDRDFKHYLALRQLAVFEFGKRNATNAPSIATRELTDAEVHVLWARLSPWEGAQGAAAKRDLDEAVTEAPSSAEAHYFRGLYWAAQHRFDAAADDLLAAARLAPNDPRYLLGILTLRAQQQPPTEHVHAGDPVMQAAEPLGQVARSPLQFQALARVYYDLGDLQQALAYAERGVALAPIDSFNLDAEAQILNALGRTQEAVDHERSAVAFLPEGIAAPQLAKRLSEYEARLQAAPR